MTHKRPDPHDAGVLTSVPHALSVRDITALYKTSLAEGLTSGEAGARLASVGPNQITTKKPKSAAQVLLHQFDSPVVLLLLAAAVIALAFGEWKEGIAIGLVLVLNAIIGFTTEWRAARSMEALRKLGNLTTRLRRDGRSVLRPAVDIVPGDIVVLEGGDVVTADLRLLEASNLAIDESALTGESLAVDKSTAAVAPDCPIGDRSCMAFKGTSVSRGSAVGVVVATGVNTELGMISELVDTATPERSPLERQLERLSGQLIKFTLVVVAALGALGVFKGGDPFLMIEASIALAVAAIPEGLPVVATMALARGMWRMARHNALIERLSAVETLGATTVIFTDKTGTLTENNMVLQRIDCADGAYVLSPDDGRFVAQTPGESAGTDRACLDDILMASVLCNNAELGDGEAKHTGDPLEQALLIGAQANGMSQQDCQAHHPRRLEIAFDSTTKLMASVNQSDGGLVMWVKGAPETVLKACSKMRGPEGALLALDGEALAFWNARTDEMAAGGMRVLAVATRGLGAAEDAEYAGLTFLGLLGLFDPPRADVPLALEHCRSAGIRVIMMTGDHAVTARNIAKAVTLTRDEPVVIEGANMPPVAEMSEAELERMRRADVFARVSPAQKLELITAYQKAGHIVAMTGDGVNDAPALKQADIGVAMGLRGTQVAREAAAMVLRDDAFGSIVAAIHEGRVIFRNIQRFVGYLLSCNLGEILVIGGAILVGLPLPLMPLQILFLNLVTDVFPAFALGAGEGRDNVLNRPPRDPAKPIVTGSIWIAIILQSVSIAAATLGAFLVAQSHLGMPPEAAVTVSFLTLAFAQLWHVFNMRDPRSGLLLNEITRNGFVWGALALSVVSLIAALAIPPVAEALDLTMPDAPAWLLILAMSLVPLLLGQIAKVALGLRYRARQAAA